MTWMYQAQPFTTAPEEYQGFVYCITNTSTGMKYIGKKNLWSILKRKPLKGKSNKRHSRIETDWQRYYGSSKTLSADIEKLEPHTITREILHLCANKTMMAYWETKLQFDLNVLYDDTYYNEFISCRINASGVK
tara:strand:- start:70 stop:471 length:402 start_codon:yes stop_codon:yes gene_type:complete